MTFVIDSAHLQNNNENFFLLEQIVKKSNQQNHFVDIPFYLKMTGKIF